MTVLIQYRFTPQMARHKLEVGDFLRKTEAEKSKGAVGRCNVHVDLCVTCTPVFRLTVLSALYMLVCVTDVTSRPPVHLYADLLP